MKHRYIFLLFAALLSCDDEDQLPEIPKQTVYNFSQEPSGVNCESGGVEISEGKDLNDDGLLDPDEITKVSYVCNNEIVDGGKTFVFISGDISNEEAAVRMSKDVGPNTQIIHIEKTTGLSNLIINSPANLIELSIFDTNGLDSLEVKGLKTASKVSVVNNSGLMKLSLQELEEVDLKLEVIGNGSLTSLDISSLHTAYVSAMFQSSALEVLDLSSLEYVDLLEISDFSSRLNDVILGEVKHGTLVVNVPSLRNLDVSQIIDAPQVDLIVTAPFSMDLDLSKLVSIHSLDLDVKSVDLTSLEAINGDNNYSLTLATPQLQLNNSPYVGLQNLVKVYGGSLNISESLSSLEEVTGQLYVIYNKDGMISFPKLQLCDQLWVEQNNEVVIDNISLDLPALDSTSFISIRKTSLTSLSFPSMTKVGGSSYTIQIYNNKNLENISFPAVADVKEGQYNFSGNALETSIVNDLLALFAGAQPELESSGVYLEDQTPPAPPSGKGISDVKELMDNGNEVIVD